MSERTTLIKKAVLTSVGASSSLDRIKDALDGAMQDLVKVGQDLIDDLEERGKVKTENAQNFLRGLQEEASKKTEKIEERVSEGLLGRAKDVGLVTREEFEDVLARLDALEGKEPKAEKEEPKKKSSKSKKASKEEAPVEEHQQES